MMALGPRGVRRAFLFSLTTTSTGALLSGHSAQTRAICAAERGFFSNSDKPDGEELARLRKENERLQKELRQRDAPLEGFFGGSRDSPERGDGGDKPGFFAGVKKFLGFEPKPVDPVTRELDKAFEGTGMMGGLIKSVFKGMLRMVGNAMAESKSDMVLVTETVERLLEPNLGAGVKCDSPMQQQYMSANVNGKTTKQMAFSCRATAASGISGAVQVRARIVDGEPLIDSLILNGNEVSASKGRAGKASLRDNSDGKIIDV